MTLARAGSVVADAATRELLGEAGGLRWSFAGERKPKGVPPVKLHRVRAATPD